MWKELGRLPGSTKHYFSVCWVSKVRSKLVIGNPSPTSAQCWGLPLPSSVQSPGGA